MSPDFDLDDRLRDLAASLPAPPPDPSGSVRRGRRRRTRRRVAGAAGTLALAGVVGAGALLLVDSAAEPQVDPPSADASTPTATVSRSADGDLDRLLGIRQAAAEHLDPGGDHISDADLGRPAAAASLPGVGSWAAVEQKIGWTNPGESGQGVIQVGVGWQLPFDCGDGGGPFGPTETCTPDRLAGTPVIRIDDPDRGTLYVLEHGDGSYASISLDVLFGNNTTVPVSSIDVTESQLAAVLTDPALNPPPGSRGAEPAPVLAGRHLRDITRSVLGDDAGRLTEESWSGDRDGYYRAGWRVDGEHAGVLLVEEGIGNFAIGDPCPRWYATRCDERIVDGVQVRIDYRSGTSRAGDGYDVTAAGPTRTIWIHWDPAASEFDAAYPVAEAVELATAAAFQ